LISLTAAGTAFDVMTQKFNDGEAMKMKKD
jgi:hypothetical protein